MNEEQHMPDELWRRAFDEAAETPPPRVWNAIERQLDEPGGGRVVPLWGSGLSRPLVWSAGLAAAVALLLVGFWLVRTEPNQQPAVARVQPTETEQPMTAVQSEPAVVPDDAVAKLATTPKTKQIISGPTATDEPKTVAAASGFTAERVTEQQREDLASKAVTSLVQTLRSVPMVPITRQAAAFSGNATPNNFLTESGFASMTPEQLASRGIRLGDMKSIQRIVRFGPVETDAFPQPDKEQERMAAKAKWASISVMPGVFNPGATAALPAYASALTSNITANMGNGSAVSSRASVAVSVQASVGVQLTDRWSVESGVGYLVGRSTIESPGAQPVYNFAPSGTSANKVSASVAGNLYTDLLRGQTGKSMANGNKGASYDNLISNTNQYANLSSNYGNRQTVSNDYAYVQVPVQVGYELRPRKRLTLAVLGGLITNIFVKNTVDDALIVKAGDGVYEPIALVASMGARFRYRSSERWSASVAGVYQPALTRGTRPDSPVQTQPVTAGVTVGVDYHF